MDNFEAGFEFPKASYQLTEQMVDEYNKAVGAQVPSEGFVPPLAVAAFAMKTMTESTFFVPGSVHASQEFEFFKKVPVGSTVNSSARVLQNIKRTGLRMVSIEINTFDFENTKVLTGKATIIIPEQQK